MKYAELFAGIGVGALAMKKVFPDAECVFYSEINQQCVKVYDKHFPGHKNVGNIDFVEIERLPKHDLIIGGSPCQDLSIARGKREGLDGDQSGLFYKFLDILREKKPKYFLLENVASMPDDDRNEISRCLGVQPVMINSVNFTGQERKRYYWFNWGLLPLPTEKVDARIHIDKSDVPSDSDLNWKIMHSIHFQGEKVKLKQHSSIWDIVAWSRSTRYKDGQAATEFIKNNPEIEFKRLPPDRISYVEQRVKLNQGVNTLVTGAHCARMSSKTFIRHGKKIRQLNRVECSRYQGLPDDYLESMAKSSAYAALGNSFTLPVIEFILESLKIHLTRDGQLS